MANIQANLPNVSLDMYSLLFTAGYAVCYEPVVDKLNAKIDRKFRKEFNAYMSKNAASNPTAYWHLYGNGHVGESSYRLFNVQPALKSKDGDFTMIFKYMPDTSQVVVDPRLVESSSKSGKSVKGRKYGRSPTYRRHRFISKAVVIDQGQTVHIVPKVAEFLAFWGEDEEKIVFSTGIAINYASKPLTYLRGQTDFTMFAETRGQAIADAVFKANSRIAEKAPKFSHKEQPMTFEQVKLLCAFTALAGGQDVSL